jgi:hypothetical protein
MLQTCAKALLECKRAENTLTRDKEWIRGSTQVEHRYVPVKSSLGTRTSARSCFFLTILILIYAQQDRLEEAFEIGEIAANLGQCKGAARRLREKSLRAVRADSCDRLRKPSPRLHPSSLKSIAGLGS